MFLAPGFFGQHRPGPQRADVGIAQVNARYSGEVRGGLMKLTVLPEGTGTPLVVKLRKGASVELVRCLCLCL